MRTAPFFALALALMRHGTASEVPTCGHPRSGPRHETGSPRTVGTGAAQEVLQDPPHRGRSCILLSFSFDEKLVAYLSDEGGRADGWEQPVAGEPAREVPTIAHAVVFLVRGTFSSQSPRLVSWCRS